MKEKKGFTLLEVIVAIIILLFIIVLVTLILPDLKKNPMRVVCGTNLKGLGTAMAVYANDYEAKFPQLPGTGPWSKRLGFDYYNTTPDFSENGAEGSISRTITASWYLLIREADVSPKSFVCDYSDNTVFKVNKDLGLYPVELWDFGPNPHKHVSYAYHNPYGKFPVNEDLPSSFAVAADMNPWIKNGDFVKTGANNQPPQILTISGSLTREQINNSNASHHEYEGQNVLYADGHNSFEKQSNVGVNNDNIYTFWFTEENPTEQDIQGGTAPTSRSPENDAKSNDDSFLAI